MKVAIISIILALCIAVCYSAPSATPKSPTILQSELNELQSWRNSVAHQNVPVHTHFTDWTYVATLFTSLKNDTNSLFESIKTTTGNEEESLRNQIIVKLDAANNQTNNLFQVITELVTDQSLSRKHTVYLQTNLIKILDNLLENLQDKLDQLSPVIAFLITDLIANAQITINGTSSQLFYIIPIYWPGVRNHAKRITSDIILVGFEQVKQIAKNENEQVGARVEVILNDLTDLFIELFKILAVAIDDETLDDYIITGYLGVTLIGYDIVFMDVGGATGALPAPVAEQIHGILESNMLSVAKKTEELRYLIRTENL